MVRLTSFISSRAVITSICVALALAACGGDGGGDTSATPSSTGAAPSGGTSVSGTVIAGAVNGATVTAYALAADGSHGDALGSVTTDSGGGFSLLLSAIPTDGRVLLVASGGTYASEFDGASIAMGSPLRAIITGVGTGAVSGVALTPLSDLLVARTVALAKSGKTLADALASAEALVRSAYGLTVAVATTKPAFDKASIGTQAYLIGLILGSFETCGKSLSPSARGALQAALALDFSDGVFDGKVNGTAVTLGDASLSSTAGTSDFLACVSTYASSGKQVVDAGITGGELSATVSSLRSSVVAAPSTPKSTGLAASSSGAISSLAFGGKQWVFIAARSQGVVAIDVTDPTAASPTVKKFDTLVTNFGGNEIGGVVPLLGADHPQLLVFSYNSKHIALVNADTGVVEFETDLVLKNGAFSFSGGSAYISGAIPDTARDGVWLSTVDGYLFFDRAAKALTTDTKRMFAFESKADVAENMGGDVAYGYLFAPNYFPGVQLADLAAGKSYFLTGTDYEAAFPLVGDPDAGSVDTGYHVGLITNEDSSKIGLINLTSVVKTDVVSGPSTFKPAEGGAVALSLGSYQPVISGSAVDGDTHLALFMAGYSTDIAVGLIQDPASVPAGGTWAGLSDWRYVTGLNGYSYAKDPHAVAVIKNLTNGKAYGYLLDGGNRKSLVVDMAALLATTPKGSTGDAAHTTAIDVVGTGIVKSISW